MNHPVIKKTCEYSNRDMYDVTRDWCYDDVYHDLGCILMEEYPESEAARLKELFTSGELESSDEYYDAVDDLIESKTGVTMKKLRYYYNKDFFEE